MNVIDVKDLRKSYGSTDVLKGINLSVEEGSILALLGPNGAGKTTTVRILATLLRFDSGTVKIFGNDVITKADGIRRRISLTGQFASIDDDLTGMENLVLVARLLGYSWQDARARATTLIESFDLGDAAHRLVKQYSGGMQRRLDIAASLVVAPDILFLDEPTTGLDPRSRRYIWDVIRVLRDNGTTVLLTTQYLEEADELADRIVILDDGMVIADGTPAELKAQVGNRMLKIRLKDGKQGQQAEQLLYLRFGVEMQASSEPDLLIMPLDNTQQLATILTAFSQAEIELAEFSAGQPSLDRVFLSLTGKDKHHQADMIKEFA